MRSGRIQGRPAPAALALASWIAGAGLVLGSVAAGAAPAPVDACTDGVRMGPTPLRRLTRFEYENTVRDLLGAEGSAAREFPEDGGSGFENNADLAVATRIHAQKFMSAAEAIAARAVADPARLLGCDPSGQREAGCVRSFIPRFAARAFRRPLTRPETETLTAFFTAERARTDLATALRLLVQSVLESPHFLYRVETGRGAGAAQVAPTALTGHELAARLSYFLWSTAPDSILARAAARGALSTPRQIEAQARRMLRDPRARITVRRFYDQWLGLTLLERMQKEKSVFPRFSKETPNLLRAQFDRFIDHVMWEADGRLDTLLTTPVTFLSGPLADFLGVPGFAGPELVRVDTGGARRAGVLTLPAFLAMQSNVEETSPIKRGMFVRENLLCQIPPSPPANMMMAQLPPATAELVTVRERLEDHRLSVGCNKCHNLFDPLGFALDSYDAVGAFRSEEKGRPLDTTGELMQSDVDGPFANEAELARRLADSPMVRGCMVKQWFRFAFGRTESAADRCTLAELERRFEAGGRSIPALLIDITTTRAFRHHLPAPAVALAESPR